MLLFVQTYQILREKIQREREREREIIYFGKMDSQINGNNNNKNNNNFQPYQQSAIGYTSRCLLGHLPGSLTGSAFWTGISFIQGNKFPLVPTFTRNFLFIYTFFTLQCPMEAIHGRRSLLHSTLSGGIIGYVGSQRNLIGMPKNIYNSIYSSSEKIAWISCCFILLCWCSNIPWYIFKRSLRKGHICMFIYK